MSDKKREIHVKDLVIKADNVIFEPPLRRSPNPFSRRRQDEMVEDSANHDESSSVLDAKDDDEDPKRPPFSWI
ncbi:hypothetical protein [Salirhabdus salicampi]|uniref:hypothetical protein n=1 Tax=Salirhabdus salicampi TaxID=476102 RepID=UPI0020C42084|nr:hypothetical protein [Salirhabdus salicampi]MCP8615604.1 hypothetical protein [Salirhabdus salicampi]